MTTPRRLLVDPVNACDYHLVSRCVQGAFLCGRDRRTGRDYSHRKQWLVDRIKLLACCKDRNPPLVVSRRGSSIRGPLLRPIRLCLPCSTPSPRMPVVSTARFDAVNGQLPGSVGDIAPWQPQISGCAA